jgi:hypothetical protein
MDETEGHQESIVISVLQLLCDWLKIGEGRISQGNCNSVTRQSGVQKRIINTGNGMHTAFQ